ncbi:hypothetical protein HD806DRAFT_489801 [Xylariaceae sp. AK1471]|nr:hypothetical protein HD806DRAFT_489801 [Xylariaceae sp. AK1471]
MWHQTLHCACVLMTGSPYLTLVDATCRNRIAVRWSLRNAIARSRQVITRELIQDKDSHIVSSPPLPQNSYFGAVFHNC